MGEFIISCLSQDHNCWLGLRGFKWEALLQQFKQYIQHEENLETVKHDHGCLALYLNRLKTLPGTSTLSEGDSHYLKVW